jgi:hypothetical protein
LWSSGPHAYNSPGNASDLAALVPRNRVGLARRGRAAMRGRFWIVLLAVGVSALSAALWTQDGAMAQPSRDQTGPPCSLPSAAAPSGPIASTSVRNDVSPPVRDIPPAASPAPTFLYRVPAAGPAACPPGAGVPLAAPPTITALSPTSGPPGTQVTIGGAGFAPDENAVLFGAGYIPHVRSPDGSSLAFTVPDSLDPECLFAQPFPCRLPSYQTEPGTYDVAVSNANGTSNHLTFEVPATSPR